MFGHAMPWIVGGGVAVSPPTTTNMVALFKLGVGQTDAGSGACSQWSDQSGLAHHLLQSTSGNRPTIQGDGTILFDGTSGSMRAQFSLVQPLTMYARAKLPTLPAGGGNRFLLDGGAGSGADQVTFFATGSLVPQLYAGSVGPSGTAVSLNTYFSVASVFNGASSVIQIGGTTSSTGNVGSQAAGGITVGASGALIANWLNCCVAEVIAYSAAHDATTRAAIIAYLDSVI